MAAANNPAEKKCVRSTSQPIQNGPKNPPRQPIPLMMAMPAMLFSPRCSVAATQNSGIAEQIPSAAIENPATLTATTWVTDATYMPTAAARNASTTCHCLSPERSECRDHNTMPTVATTYGRAVIQPVCATGSPCDVRMRGIQKPSP